MIASFVGDQEGRNDVSGPAISVAVRQENDRLEALGEPLAFRCYPESEVWGWVALGQEGTVAGEGELAGKIRQLNVEVEQTLRKRLAAMDWRAFESTFLTQVLEKLGFQDVEITQATRDGGVDARVTYRRGLVQAQAIVSAKHWKNRVPVDEVRNVRGIKGPEDTAIIVTTGTFSPDATKEAEPGQNQRAVYLIDGQRLVEICRDHAIGVRTVQLPKLLVIDEASLPGAHQDEADEDANEDEADGESGAGSLRRLRLEMLGDPQRGLAVQEIAELLDLQENSVRTYLSDPNRKRGLFERLRQERREAALRMVATKRVNDQVSDESQEVANAGDSDDELETAGRRLRIEMLGDPDRGLSAEEIAQLTQLQVASVRNYLYTPDRKQDLFERIRLEHRDAALAIVARKRAKVGN
jgi:predicted transcriptional regulator